jgi:hypothetical protein
LGGVPVEIHVILSDDLALKVVGLTVLLLMGGRNLPERRVRPLPRARRSRRK